MFTMQVTHINRIVFVLGVLLLTIVGHPGAFAQGDAPFDDRIEIRRTSQGDAFTSSAGHSVVRIGNYPFNDCNADLAIADRNFGNGVGRVYYYRGDTGAAIRTFVPPRATIKDFGKAITGIGDVDGDGFPDIAISAKDENAEAGVVFIFAGDSGDVLAELAAVDDTTSFGDSIAGLGDMDGRPGGLGFGLVVGERLADPIGAAYVYEASNAGATWTLRSTLASSSQGITSIGSLVASAGHVNSDGAVDIIVSGVLVDNVKGKGWQVYSNPVISLTANPLLYESGSGAPCIVGGVDDVDGDGLDDFAVAFDTTGNPLQVFSGADASQIGDTIDLEGGIQNGWLWGGVNYDSSSARSVVMVVWTESVDNPKQNVGHADLYRWNPDAKTPAWYLDYQLECESVQQGPGAGGATQALSPTIGGDVIGDTNLDGLTDLAVANNDMDPQTFGHAAQVCVFYEDNESYAGGWMNLKVSRLVAGQTGTLTVEYARPSVEVLVYVSLTATRGLEEVDDFSQKCKTTSYVLLDEPALALSGTTDGCGRKTFNFTVPSGWEDTDILIQAVQCGSAPWSRLVLRTVD